MSVIALFTPGFPGKSIPSALARGKSDGEIVLNGGTQSGFRHRADWSIQEL